eukprot:6204211-Pleurochrysis_carterae.AAC.4
MAIAAAALPTTRFFERIMQMPNADMQMSLSVRLREAVGKAAVATPNTRCQLRSNGACSRTLTRSHDWESRECIAKSTLSSGCISSDSRRVAWQS